MYYGEFKAPKGIIKVSLELDGTVISDINISGDFFMYPEEALDDLERLLVGAKAERAELSKLIEQFYEQRQIQAPMLTPDCFVEAIMRAVRR
ncbi:MAG TPA: lipoate protein ligase C-terminal domain-containing protein [Acetomicrobium flavidum]|uniref:lipoate protein ligase C-terminal domain-containing protein n=1 Tax=Acetomicrobium flavidum TaxID=49896 RepID=UPI002BE334DB|nr:lipoate protein ligase C-terminal domain-containing protein [Acetomicrobium flavidum]HPU69700.1 lipoate protein ligase C-terminal domain-containing protein [Acetomicrobium flavidum]